jgi:uncharacterized SAM-binding protein YcdF (DUF218 family)
VAQPRSRARKLILIALAALTAAIAFHSVWLSILGRYLVKQDTPEKADAALVLGGDYFGNRILKGAELVREGYVPKVLVSGPRAYYGWAECDLAIPFAVKQGYPAEWFVPLRHGARSTEEEALAVVPEMRKRGVHKFLLVTSNYHTRRSARTFRPLLGDLEMKVVASRDEEFEPDRWWKTRQGRKVWLFEWAKTVANWVGL